MSMLALLTFLTIPSFSSDWQWGSEGYKLCSYTEPTGLLGCRWFNYRNGWGDLDADFEGWRYSTYVYEAYCFQGAIASVMLYYGWPDRSRLNGSLYDDFLGIDHRWRYDAIGDFSNCADDDPNLREIPNCRTTDSPTAAHEIARLFLAVRMAANYYEDEYECLFERKNLFRNIMKTRLGFSNVRTIARSGDRGLDIVINELKGDGRDLPEPVIGFSDSHMWIIDDYRVRDSAGTILREFHVLSYDNNCNHHTAHWEHIDSSDANFFLVDLRPDIIVTAGDTAELVLPIGKGSIPCTKGTNRVGGFRLVADNEGKMELNVQLIRIGSDSIEYDTVLHEEYYVTPAGLETPQFTYHVPDTARCRVKAQLINRGTETIRLRMVLNDQQNNPEERVPIHKPKTSPLTFVSPPEDMTSCSPGDTLPIRWCSSDKEISAVELDISADRGITWVSLCNHSVETKLVGEYLWTVPDSIAGNPLPIPLIGRQIFLRVTGYQNKLARTVREHPISVIDKESAVRPGEKPPRPPRAHGIEPDTPFYTTAGRLIANKKRMFTAAGVLLPTTTKKRLVLLK